MYPVSRLAELQSQCLSTVLWLAGGSRHIPSDSPEFSFCVLNILIRCLLLYAFIMEAFTHVTEGKKSGGCMYKY